MTERGRPTVELLYVAPANEDHRIDDALGDARPSLSVVVADGVADADERIDDSVDCVVSHYDLADGAGVEVVDFVRRSHPTVPVVVLVDVRDGSRLATAVESDADECIPVSDDVSIDRVLDAVDEFVPAPDGPLIADPYPIDTRSVYEWKANLFDQLLSRFAIHVFVKDEGGRHVLLSEGLTEDSENVLGKSDVEIGFVAPEEARRAYEDDLRVVETGEPIAEKEEFYRSVDLWNLTSKVPWYDTNGDIAGLIGVSHDITERKKRERQLEIINHLLRHNLRNDMSVVRGYAELIREEVDDDFEIPDRIIRTVDDLIETADKQQEIVDALTENRSTETIDVVEVIERAVELVADRHPNARIDCDLPATLRVRAIDEIERALVELIENAVVHTSAESPAVVVRAERRAKPKDERGEAKARITVADGGPRIPEMEVAAITGERELEPLFHGSGLGLSLVNWIVSQSDGKLDFEWNDRGGNLVIVTLPLVE